MSSSQQGQVGSVDALFRQSYATLVRTLGFAFGFDAASEAVQEGFLEADRHWRRVSEMDDPAAWVRRVAINRLLNQRRGFLRRRSAELSQPVAAEAGASEVSLDLRRAIHHLPPRQRAAVYLYYLEDLRVEDVAFALNISPGAVKSSLHDARRALRKQLQVHDG